MMYLGKWEEKVRIDQRAALSNTHTHTHTHTHITPDNLDMSTPIPQQI